MSKQLFQGTKILSRLILRRDRSSIPIWILAIAVFSFLVALTLPSIYPSGPDRQIMAETMKNPAMISMVGPGYGLDNYHNGAIMAHQMLLFTALTVGIMSIMLVVRHTRRDEESGRIEVIRSLPVGKLANVGSALLVASGASLTVGMVVGFGLFFLGIESMDLSGSLLYGAVLTATGVFFAAAAALFAQLAETGRGASGYSFAFLGLAYLARAIGDIGSETLSLLSPLGLVLRAQVYVNNYWWPVWVTLGTSALVAVFALRLNAIRDLEAGFIPVRPGPRTASRFLQTPLGLALRLQRNVIIGWAFGMFILGVSYGSIFGDIDTFFQTSDLYQELLPILEGFSLTEQFVAMLLSVMAMASAIPAIQVVLKLRAEEKANRTVHLLARAVSRTNLMGSYLLIAVVVAFAMQVLSILGMWSAAVSVMDDPMELGITLQGAMAYVPPIWIMVGFAAVLVGYLPTRVALAWLYLGYTFFVVYLGRLLQLPEWLEKLTPFGHVSNVPMEAVNPILTAVLVLMGLTLMGLGLLGFRQRDILE